MKNKVKRVVFILIINLILCCYLNFVFASDLTNGITIGNNTKGQFAGVGNTVLGVVQVVGVISSVAALMLLGIKYMVGSLEEKAEYKKTFPIYILGALLVFGLSAFLKIFVDFFGSLL